MGAVSVSTPDDIEQAGGKSAILPMTAVWSKKANDLSKCRGCVCGNFQAKDPTERVWTAQAETSSVMAGLRVAQLRNWSVGKLDVKGAFMYAPLPEGLLIIVRPPKIWETLGLVPPGTLWTLQKAVYGLRCAPRAWGTYRDKELRAMRWKHGGKTFRLIQCVNDAQVWKISQEGGSGILGLLLVYVDDFMLLSPAVAIQTELIRELGKKVEYVD